jgi:hypothetical protein
VSINPIQNPSISHAQPPINRAIMIVVTVIAAIIVFCFHSRELENNMYTREDFPHLLAYSNEVLFDDEN